MPSLVRHPDTPPGAIHTVEAELQRVAGGTVAMFRAMGDISRLVIPPPANPVRTEGLWQSTCFELFVAGEGETYREFNFSPSGAWAAYAFDGHRRGMRDFDAKVEIQILNNSKVLSLIAEIEAEFSEPARIGLTAVIFETDAVTRYWATAFAPGEPDFHAAAVRSLIFDGVSAE
ncbi:MAG TPA: hypothetical protein VEB39_08650 [Sphingomicrobium sp.]|nr:hypothetical protein [Sphingomicrobium sp.]